MRQAMIAAAIVFSFSSSIGSVGEAQAQISFGSRGFGISIGGTPYVGPYPYGPGYGRSGVSVGVGIGGYGSGVGSSYPAGTTYYRSSPSRRSVSENPLPREGANLPIKITRSDDFDAPLSYTLNDHEYKMRPGESQWLLNDRDWEIEFDRGGDFGLARYSMSPGIYTFKLTKKGWEIFHDDDLSKLSVTTEAKGAKDNTQPPRPKDVE